MAFYYQPTGEVCPKCKTGQVRNVTADIKVGS